MANTNTLALIVLQQSIEQRVPHATDLNMNMLQPPTQQIPNSSDGPVAIFWDIENCPVPSDVSPEDVGGNVRMALRIHPVIKGDVIVFSAYGDFNAFPRRLREGCQRTGVKLIDVPNGRKDAADKAILVDMFLFALDHPPPSSIMLISGDIDFAPALHVLGQRGYTVILVIPSGVGVSSALCSAGKFVWDWPSVAHGEGFVPPTKVLIHPCGPAEVSGYLMGFNDNLGGQNEEAILYSGLSQPDNNAGDTASIVEEGLQESRRLGEVRSRPESFSAQPYARNTKKPRSSGLPSQAPQTTRSMPAASVTSIGPVPSGPRQIVCYICQQTGHRRAECPQGKGFVKKPSRTSKYRPQGNTSSAGPLSCFRCGEPGHKARECPRNGERAKGKIQQATQSTQSAPMRRRAPASGARGQDARGAQGREYAVVEAHTAEEETTDPTVAQGSSGVRGIRGDAS